MLRLTVRFLLSTVSIVFITTHSVRFSAITIDTMLNKNGQKDVKCKHTFKPPPCESEIKKLLNSISPELICFRGRL